MQRSDRHNSKEQNQDTTEQQRTIEVEEGDLTETLLRKMADV